MKVTLLGLEHVPSAVEHTPATWHWSRAVQTLGLPPWHTPLEQVSVRVQGLPSLQGEASGCSVDKAWSLSEEEA